MSFPPSFWDHLSDRLELAIFDTNMEYRQMAISPTLQGLGKKIAQFKHDVEFEAAKVSTEVDTARTETMDTFSGVNNVLAAHKKDLEDVKSFVAEVAQATNGGPALNPPATHPPAPTDPKVGPYPTYP